MKLWQAPEFAATVIAWQRAHGRHDLPWQQTRDPYRVWLSEIMLQQTQVQTVLGYYARFLARFPDVFALAAAPEGDVMALWSGLGYYARARNLHACAQVVVAEHRGVFPATAEELARLPGIGPSTAAAVAAFCFGGRAAIFDANVKRVLARVFGTREDITRVPARRALWQRARALLPDRDLVEAMPAYTQGLMDLGATVCRARAPRCEICPLRSRCVAAQSGEPERYPPPKPAAKRQRLIFWLLDARDPAGCVWLVRRKGNGIWAGLNCLPQYRSQEALLAALPADLRAGARECARFSHGLTHRDLDIRVVGVACDAAAQPAAPGAWHGPDAWRALGLPAPVRRYLEACADGGLFTLPARRRARGGA